MKSARSDKEMFDLVLDTARDDDRIRAVILNGSRANPDAKLHKAHNAIDEQESRDRTLCLAYFALKEELDEQEEDGPPMVDFMEDRVDD